MAAQSLTLNYDALLSTTLFNYQKEMVDQISTANAFLYTLMNKEEDGYVSEDNIGDRAQIPLEYELQDADTYAGYDVITPTPIDGVTSAFYPWCQMANTIMISGLEEKKNSSEARLINLLETKTKQATGGFQTKFNKVLIQGNGVNVASQVASNYVSPDNGSTGFDPLAKSVSFAPTSSVIVGGINQASEAWWQNKYYDMSSTAAGSGSPTPQVTTFTGFLKALRHLRNECSKGIGGPPNLFLANQGVYELYEAALAAAHRNPSYQTADIPFDNVAFYGKPIVWDEFMIDAKNGSTSINGTNGGTIYMLNTKFWKLKYHSGTNFVATPFQKALNQDAKSAMILWLGALMSSNRRKQGVGSGIDMTIAS